VEGVLKTEQYRSECNNDRDESSGEEEGRGQYYDEEDYVERSEDEVKQPVPEWQTLHEHAPHEVSDAVHEQGGSKQVDDDHEEGVDANH
jgi:hypothetical protein